MIKSHYINQIIVVMLAVVFAVGVAGCGSSKKNTKTAQSTPTENVKDHYTSKNKKDKGAPAAVTDALVSEARTWIGVPYKYGGHSREGADCSGFLMEVFKNAVNVDLPRTTSDQRELCVEVDRDNIAVGDILFFSSNNSSGKIAHVGMYVGDGRMIHASSSRGVVEDNLDLNYYVKHFQSIGRVPELAQANPVPPSIKPKAEELQDQQEPKREPIVVKKTVVETKVDTVKVDEPAKIDAAAIVKNAFGAKKAQ